jgi:hypothetical protein
MVLNWYFNFLKHKLVISIQRIAFFIISIMDSRSSVRLQCRECITIFSNFMECFVCLFFFRGRFECFDSVLEVRGDIFVFLIAKILVLH